MYIEKRTKRRYNMLRFSDEAIIKREYVVDVPDVPDIWEVDLDYGVEVEGKREISFYASPKSLSNLRAKWEVLLDEDIPETKYAEDVLHLAWDSYTLTFRDKYEELIFQNWEKEFKKRR